MSRLVAAAAALGLAGALLLIAAPSALALTCGPHDDASPEAIAAGRERLATDSPFFDTYDVAVIGTVTAVATEEPAVGRAPTTISVSVAGVLGADRAPSRVEVSAGDPGWMLGYPFEDGTDYFIPVQDPGPEGETNFSFLCDPISEVPDAGALVDRLEPLAAGAGIPLARPGGEAAGEPERAGHEGGTPTRTLLIGAAGLALLAGAATALPRFRGGAR